MTHSLHYFLPAFWFCICMMQTSPPGSAYPSVSEPIIKLSQTERDRIFRHSPLPPPPPDKTNRWADNPTAARLGQFLFFDTRLSGNGEISCATCHDPEKGFSDGRTLARGVGEVPRHSPTIWNVAYQRWFFWDGRTDSLWAQAVQPLESAVEMNGSRLQSVHLIRNDPELRQAYEKVFGLLPVLSDQSRFPAKAKPIPGNPADPLHLAWTAMSSEDRQSINLIFSRINKAIAAYERLILSRNAPFDKFVIRLRDGDPLTENDFTVAALKGLRLFVGKANCRLCHSGPNFSDGEFHNVGVPPLKGGFPRDSGRYAGIKKLLADPFRANGAFSDEPQGVAAMRTGTLVNYPDNWGRFRTPSLRNVAATPPYMHQGQYDSLQQILEHYSTLKDAVQMDHHQEQILKPLNLTDEEISDIIVFLKSLTDQNVPVHLLRPPKSPVLEP